MRIPPIATTLVLFPLCITLAGCTKPTLTLSPSVTTIGQDTPMTVHALDKHGVSKLRFYVSGENLFTISHVGAPIDPEITDGESSSQGRTFPFSKTYSFGTQLTF